MIDWKNEYDERNFLRDSHLYEEIGWFFLCYKAGRIGGEGGGGFSFFLKNKASFPQNYWKKSQFMRLKREK